LPARSLQDAPPASGSQLVTLAIKAGGKGKKSAGRVEVSASAGRASARAEYDAADVRKLQANPLVLADVARISVLHSSLMEQLVRLSHERCV
jgi:hypothetical protein